MVYMTLKLQVSVQDYAQVFRFMNLRQRWVHGLNELQRCCQGTSGWQKNTWKRFSEHL